MPDEQTPATPAAEKTTDKKDLLNTPAPEAAEMDALLNQGLAAHNTVGFLTFIGLILIGAAVLYWKFDRITAERAFGSTLDQMVNTQAEKDFRAYRKGEDIYIPDWPRQLYAHLRDDIFRVGLLAAAVALIFIYIERAKMRRSDVLVYRSLAREIEKLRLRVKQLEGGKTSASSDSATSGPAETPSADDNS